MDGRGWAFALIATLWTLVVALTLGLAYPWAKAALERYQISRTRFGDLHGAFVGTGGALFKAGSAIWCVIPMIILAYLGLGMGSVWNAPNFAQTLLIMPFGPLMILVAWLAAPAIVTRWTIDNTRFGSVSFDSRLRPLALLGPYLGFAASMIVLTIAALIPPESLASD
jgi:uncharacterized membrane protein YjgN (DUF898 family)